MSVHFFEEVHITMWLCWFYNQSTIVFMLLLVLIQEGHECMWSFQIALIIVWAVYLGYFHPTFILDSKVCMPG